MPFIYFYCLITLDKTSDTMSGESEHSYLDPCLTGKAFSLSLLKMILAVGFSEMPIIILKRASLVTQTVKNLSSKQETQVQSLGQENLLEKGMATYSSILPWRIPSTEEFSRLQCMGRKEQLTLSLSYWKSPLLSLAFPVFFIKKLCWILSNASASTETIAFFFFVLLMWCIKFIFLCQTTLAFLG